jgi:hypothetical protein
MMRIALLHTCLFLTILAACSRSTAPSTPSEAYMTTDGSVGVDIMRMGGEGSLQRWLATYTDGTQTTRFTIELEPATASGGPGSPITGKGKFISEAGSDPIPLLESLKRALQARRMPSNVQKVDELAFNYLVIGEHQSRSATGALQAQPSGNWEASKVFLANDQAQVYFNFNPVMHKAEFSIKDAEYGDRVLAELAKVF